MKYQTLMKKEGINLTENKEEFCDLNFMDSLCSSAKFSFYFGLWFHCTLITTAVRQMLIRSYSKIDIEIKQFACTFAFLLLVFDLFFFGFQVLALIQLFLLNLLRPSCTSSVGFGSACWTFFWAFSQLLEARGQCSTGFSLCEQIVCF